MRGRAEVEAGDAHIVLMPDPRAKRGGALEARELFGLQFGSDGGDAEASGHCRATLVFGEHARELISTELAYTLSVLLSGDADTILPDSFTSSLEHHIAEGRVSTSIGGDEGMGSGERLRAWAGSIRSRCEVTIVPNLLRDVRDKVEDGSYCLRTDLGAVDPNRDYPTGFREYFEGSGAKPFATWETRALQAFVASRQQSAFINYHSGEYSMYYPWDHKPEKSAMLPKDIETIVASMNKVCQCVTGIAGLASEYEAYGSAIDYFHSVEHIPYSMTFEIFGPKDRGRYGNPLYDRRAMRRKLHMTNQECFYEFNPLTVEEYGEALASFTLITFIFLEQLAQSEADAQAVQKVAENAAMHLDQYGSQARAVSSSFMTLSFALLIISSFGVLFWLKQKLF